MNYNPKVVSIDRSAAYMHHRAMKNRRDNNPVDALELMRHAVERSPENAEYKLDLAEMYCEMGCHERSNRILLDLIAEQNAPSECYYGLALNQLSKNDFESARRAFNIYLSCATDEAYIEDARNITAEMDMFQEINRIHSRKNARAAKIASRACDELKNGEVQKALRMFERSLSMDPGQDEMRTLYAMALRMNGDIERALEEAERSVASVPENVRVLSVAAQIYWMCDDGLRAQELIRRAVALRPEGVELRLLIFALSEMNMMREAADMLRLALQETPFDRHLLHMRAVAMHRLGVPDVAVSAFWLRILRIDPEDTVAAYYQEAALANRLNESDPGFVYEVPDGEFRRRIVYLADQVGMGLDRALELWKTDASFRALLYWAVCTGNESCGCAAIMVIGSAGDAESESMLRELLYRREIPIGVKRRGLMFLRLRGGNVEKMLPPDVDVRDGILPDAEEMLARLPAVERQLVRYANEVLAREYNINALSALTVLWSVYRQMCKNGKDVLVSTQEAAAALAWNYLLMHGRQTGVNRLAAQFHCRPRRMVFYAGRIASVIERTKGADTDEDY